MSAPEHRSSTVAPRSATGPVHVLVAGVPYSYSRPFPDGHWLTEAHRTAIESVSPRINLMHMTRDELAAGEDPEFPPEVILTETTGTATELDDTAWVEHLVRGADLERTFSPNLRWLQLCSHGIEKVAPMLRPPVTLIRAVDVHGTGVAESVLAAMLMHAKRLVDRIENQRSHTWKLLKYGELHGRTIVILGAGSLGSAVARLARAFGMHVIGMQRSPRPSPHYDEMVGRDALADILPKADYLVVALPKTPSTISMVRAAELALLPTGAYVVNIGRGEVLDENDLMAALRTGALGGAYLDVFVDEPLPAGSQIWDTPNILITPHDAHRSSSVGDRNISQFRENLTRYLEGRSLVGVADLDAGY